MKLRRKRAPSGARERPLAPLPFNLLCVTVACVLIAHAPHMPAWYTMALAAVAAARWGQRRRRPGRVAAWLRIALLLGVPLAVTIAYGSPFGQEAGAALVCGLLVVKLLESERARDARMAAGFACFILMSALLFDQSLLFTLALGLMLLPPLAMLRAIEPGASPSGWLQAFRPAGALLLAGLPIALLGFLLVPRLATPLWGAPDQGAGRTGMTDRMAPGDLHSLLTDDSVAMRIGFDGPPPSADRRYFRGMVLWHFDGRAWIAGAAADRTSTPAAVHEDGPPTRYDVTLVPSHRHWLFALDVPLGAPEGAHMGPDRTLSSTTRVNQPLRYQLTSATDYRLAPAPLDPRLRAAALQLPDGFDPRARELAERWRAASGDNDALIVRDALARFHDDGYVYDLNAPPLGRNSIDDFLFDTRSGFCEHYASAFTFLMRAAGIPARVVVGYQGGYWNGFAHYLLVRQSDAHSWTEVWLAGRGWVRIDPTAAVSRMALADDGGALGDLGAGGGSWWLPWQDRLDIVNRWWTQTVVGFDALRQAGLLRPFGIAHAGAQALGVALAIGVFLALGFGALLAARRPRRPPRDALAIAEARMEHRLARAGVRRGTGEGPRDFYARGAAALPASARALDELGAEYIALRYAHLEPPPERVRAFARRTRHFRPRRMVK